MQDLRVPPSSSENPEAVLAKVEEVERGGALSEGDLEEAMGAG
jgi:hypothetical protein